MNGRLFYCRVCRIEIGRIGSAIDDIYYYIFGMQIPLIVLLHRRQLTAKVTLITMQHLSKGDDSNSEVFSSIEVYSIKLIQWRESNGQRLLYEHLLLFEEEEASLLYSLFSLFPLAFTYTYCTAGFECESCRQYWELEGV